MEKTRIKELKSLMGKYPFHEKIIEWAYELNSLVHG